MNVCTKIFRSFYFLLHSNIQTFYNNYPSVSWFLNLFWWRFLHTAPRLTSAAPYYTSIFLKLRAEDFIWKSRNLSKQELSISKNTLHTYKIITKMTSPWFAEWVNIRKKCNSWKLYSFCQNFSFLKKESAINCGTIFALIVWF